MLNEMESNSLSDKNRNGLPGTSRKIGIFTSKKCSNGLKKNEVNQ
jgi:hypothetical protein